MNQGEKLHNSLLLSLSHLTNPTTAHGKQKMKFSSNFLISLYTGPFLIEVLATYRWAMTNTYIHFIIVEKFQYQ